LAFDYVLNRGLFNRRHLHVHDGLFADFVSAAGGGNQQTSECGQPEQ
jgi:hypothetical protein